MSSGQIALHMAKFKVVLVEHGYPTTQLERRIVTAAGGQLIDADRLPREEALRLCEDADAVVVRWLRVTPEVIERFRRCKIILRYGVGTDNVDAPAATAAGILIGHVPCYCTEDVATHTVALLLACVRDLVPTHRKLAGGGWDMNPPEKLWRVSGRTLGLVGFGKIGQAVARLLSGWGLTFLATDPFVEPERAQALGVRLVELKELLRSSDYVSLHVPLLPETQHLINAHTLAWMKDGAILINTARGPVVDTGALLAALDEGRLARAGVDVFEEEPLSLESPLRRHPRGVLTDHAAWYSEDSLAELQRTVAEEAVRVCTGGLPLAIANPEVLRGLGRLDEWTPNETTRWQLKRLKLVEG